MISRLEKLPCGKGLPCHDRKRDRKIYRHQPRRRRLDGVVKVVTFKDVPDHCYPTPGHPWSVEPAHQDVADRNILTGRIRYYGDDIAAVVAQDEVTASRALRLIKVEYEEYPVEIHPRKSMYGSHPPIHFDKKDNVLNRTNFLYRKCGSRDWSSRIRW